jgi:DNA invertase Pin-like site-specific DNA recombinase
MEPSMVARGEKAVSYLRVSGKGQVRGDGLPRQRDVVQRFARSKGVQIVEEFTDEGVSGTKELEGRTGLAALLDFLESDGIRLVLVERADRLARDLVVGEVILGRLRSLGVEVVSADSGTELTVGDDDPTRKLIRQVLGAVAEYDKAVIVLKLRAARERVRRARGRCEGRKPFGSRPGEDDVLQLIRQLYRKPRGGARRSCAQIARELNERGIRTRTGYQWSRGVVWALLSREAASRAEVRVQRPPQAQASTERTRRRSRHSAAGAEGVLNDGLGVNAPPRR